jgi:uncharacterized protein (DUF305 family)
VLAAGLLAAGLTAAAAGCGGAARPAAAPGAAPHAASGTPPAATPRTPAEQARADGGRPAYTAADARFMRGMIAHHAQAVVMADWAATHGARADVRVLAGRILVAQQDEIALMQRWLRERGESVPDAGAAHDAASHHTAGHAVPDTNAGAPGMLTREQLARLDAARGAEFDRLFLTFMIQHHEGALTMVRQLFASPGAAQDVDVFRLASDIEADQVTEIERMHAMRSAQPPAAPRP